VPIDLTDLTPICLKTSISPKQMGENVHNVETTPILPAPPRFHSQSYIAYRA
jgi:hypothetical protein